MLELRARGRPRRLLQQHRDQRHESWVERQRKPKGRQCFSLSLTCINAFFGSHGEISIAAVPEAPQGKGSVLAMEAVETHRAKAVS